MPRTHSPHHVKKNIMTTTHAVILAAGFGSRLGAKEGHKLLAQVGGRTMLEHHLDNFRMLGITTLSIVTGFRHEALELAIHEATNTDTQMMHVRTAYNKDFEGSNGLSVLASMSSLDEEKHCPFWLTMADHLFEPALFTHIKNTPNLIPAHAHGALFIDRKLDTIYDMPDATKLWLDAQNHMLAIGKEIPQYNVIDVGLFWCDTLFLHALRREREVRGDCSTSDAVRRLNQDRCFAFLDVGHATWQDVDTPGAQAHAEQLIQGWSKSAQ